MRSYPCIAIVLAWLMFSGSTFLSSARAEEPSPADEVPRSRSDKNAPINITFEMLKHERRDKIAPTSATVLKNIRDWNGRLVSIEGYMLPTANLRIKSFVLETTPFMDPHVKLLADEHVIVTCDGTEFSIRPVRVIGRFSIEDLVEGKDKVHAMYRISEARVELAK
jgi:hypothetical protein